MQEEKSEEKSLEQALKECEKQKSEYLAGWQRERADFLNYKKEEEKRLEKFLEFAKEEFILKILPILDNFKIAACRSSENKKEEEWKGQIIEGFLQIKIQLENFLKTEGVEEIKSTGEPFDPSLHEAVEQEEIEGANKKSGIIVKEIQKGYKINGRLLRPAKVKVAK